MFPDDCASGLACVDGGCTASRAKLYETCGDLPCEDGLFCMKLESGGHECMPVQPAGTPCSSSNFGQCAGVCAPNGSKQETCVSFCGAG